MATSRSALGAHYKTRSRDWLQKHGFTVFDMELVRTNFTPMGPVRTKRDQLGADLGYLADDVVVFVQVKGGLASSASLTKAAAKRFADFRFPIYCRRELHIWRRRAHDPQVVTWT